MYGRSRYSDLVKDMLNEVNVQDMEYAPQNSFESGTKVQVLKGNPIPDESNKLFALYSSHNSLSEIDETRKNRVAYLTRR